MKRFRFPLRPVAVLRAHREARAREAFSAAIHVYVQSERDLTSARARVARLEAELFSAREHGFNAAEETYKLAGYRKESDAEVEAERVMLAAREAMNQRRSEYLEAHRQLEVVNRLEAKAKAAHRQETNREEQIEFDDFATRRAARHEPLFSQ